MITRYSRPEMRAIWTDETKLRIWLQIELLAAEALVAEGIVPRADFAKMKAGAEKWFADLPGLVARQKELEKVLNHDVIGFTTAVAEKINHPASRWFHFGLTSSDIIDTAFAVQMVQSADILLQDVQALRASIAKQARKYKFTPCIGRSHGIHAEPTTFGLKLALMHDEFGRALERLVARARSGWLWANSPVPSAPARTCRRRLRRRSANNSVCDLRPSPPRSSSATSTPSS